MGFLSLLLQSPPLSLSLTCTVCKYRLNSVAWLASNDPGVGSPSIYCGNEGRLDTGKGKRPFVVGVGGGGGQKKEREWKPLEFQACGTYKNKK